MNKIVLSTLLATSVILGACAKESLPTSAPDSIPQEEFQQQVESSGNPETDLQAIEKDVSDLDADTDFDTFSQNDLTAE